jgi:hypothetical protein
MKSHSEKGCHATLAEYKLQNNKYEPKPTLLLHDDHRRGQGATPVRKTLGWRMINGHVPGPVDPSRFGTPIVRKCWVGRTDRGADRRNPLGAVPIAWD